MRKAMVSLVTLALVAAACSGGDDGSAADETTASTAATQTTSSATTASSETTQSTAPASDDSSTTSEAGTEGGSSAGPSSGGGTCTIDVTGDREGTWTFDQAITSFSTDYWISAEDLRQTVEFLGEDIAGGSYDEIVARGDPITTLLSIGCSDPENLILGAVLTHTNETKTTDVPMAPGSYAITGGLFDATGPPGTMIADLSISEDELYGTIGDSGTLDITRWDLEGIDGSFSFSARESFADAPREIDVAVTFSFVCREWFSGC